jgi:hypothetical protein
MTPGSGPKGDLSANTTLANFGGLGVMSPTTMQPGPGWRKSGSFFRLSMRNSGRGNSQIQIQTRSGTNKYSGSAVWNIQNSALNANTWANNRNTDPRTGAWAPLTPDWRNVNQYTGQLRRTDRSKQDVLLCVVGSEHLRAAVDTESSLF